MTGFVYQVVVSNSSLCDVLCVFSLLDVNTTALQGHTGTARPGGTESRPEIVGCTAVQRRGAGAMEVEDDTAVGGTEITTATTIGTTGVELITTGAVRGSTTEARGNVGIRNGREVQSISCRRLEGENTRQIRYL